jgi:RNA polymerase sporulation-specific sigma factor
MRPVEDDVERQVLCRSINKPSEREKTIVSMRYGLFGQEEKTQKEVADCLGISQSYISRLEKRIIHKLKKEMVRLL